MKEMNLYLLLTLFSLVFSQQCIVGSNCPYNQGICVGNTCQCLDGYKNFFNPALLPEQQIYCNYQQINHYYPLLLELFPTSLGHFYVGKYWFGLIKLCLAITFVSTSLYLYKKLQVASYIKSLWETIKNKIIPDELKSGRGGITIEEVAQFLFNITFHPFWILYAFDIYMYWTKSYRDGNGIELY